MIELFRRYPRAVGFSIVLHLVVIGLALLEFSGKAQKQLVSNPGPVEQTIQAEVIDQKKLDEREQKIRRLEQQKKQREAEQQRLKEAAKQRAQEMKRKQQEQEKQRKQAELKRQREEAARKKKLAEEKRRKEEERKAVAEKKRQAEEQKRAEEEKKRQEEARIRAEQERLEAELAQRLKAEEEQRQQAEAEQRRKEAELKARLAAEERQRAMNAERNRYHRLIQQKIQRNWRQPVKAGNMPRCEVNVIQGPGGVILDVTFGKCPGTREYRLSVEAAVLKSDPLPTPAEQGLFDRNLKIFFEPKK